MTCVQRVAFIAFLLTFHGADDDKFMIVPRTLMSLSVSRRGDDFYSSIDCDVRRAAAAAVAGLNCGADVRLNYCYCRVDECQSLV